MESTVRERQFKEIEDPYADAQTTEYISALIDACKRVGDEIGWELVVPQHYPYPRLLPPGTDDPVEFRLGNDPDCIEKLLPGGDPRWQDCIVAAQRVRVSPLWIVEKVVGLRFLSPLRDVAHLTPSDDLAAAMEEAVRDGLRRSVGFEA